MNKKGLLNRLVLNKFIVLIFVMVLAVSAISANGVPQCETNADCDDGNPCTYDSCMMGGMCDNIPNLNPCDDGNVCTIDDICLPDGSCNGNLAPESTPCDDGDACTIMDTCSIGTCIGGPEPNCDDNNPCTSDSCSPFSGCINEPDSSCDDSVCGNGIIEGDEQCDNGVANQPEGTMDPVWNLVAGEGDRAYCSDECIVYEVPGTWCGDQTVQETYEDCDDGNNDNGDGCEADCTYECVADADCDDEDACTDDVCDGNNQCQNTLIPPEPCGEGQYCTGEKTCENGEWSDCDTIGVECGSCFPLFGCGIDGNWNTLDYLTEGTKTCTSEGVCSIDSCIYESVCADPFVQDDSPLTPIGIVVGCEAICDQDSDCIDTNCDHLDDCYEGRHRDCDDTPNDCKSDCSCEINDCLDPSTCRLDVPDDDQDGYDEGCGDCDDSDATVYPEAPEICDGLDNDCDGDVDEDLTAPLCPLQDGVCSGATQTCGGVDGWLACDASSYGSDYEASETSCDGLDNDCDYAVDEELGTTTCGLGECEHTIDNCVGGEEQTCDPMEGASTEVCDGSDNDCDGDVDEDFTDLEDLCTVGLGECEVSGEKVCKIDGSGTECDAVPGTPTSETCNNLDDDCDGTTDEELTQPTTCGQGECAGNTGQETCSAGSWIGNTCDPFDGAIPETCDNLDNNCDGTTDEELTQPTTCGQGECAGNTGEETCSAGSWIDDTCDEFAGSSAEVCDNLDNDCDGDIDEEPEASQSCDDTVGCTDDVCVSGSCQNTPDNNYCYDQNECTEDICDALLDCQNIDEPVGTQCGDPRDCLDDVCSNYDLGPFAEFYPVDGHDTCDGAGTCEVYSCAMEDSYCTDNDPLDGINGLTCGAQCDQDADCSHRLGDPDRGEDPNTCYYDSNICNLDTCGCGYEEEYCPEPGTAVEGECYWGERNCADETGCSLMVSVMYDWEKCDPVYGPVKPFDIELQEGWNLISLPVRPLEQAPEDLFADIADDVEIVWSYDKERCTDGWCSYNPVGTDDLPPMDAGYGYWVKMKDSAILEGEGRLGAPGQFNPPSRILEPGWNLIGYYEVGHPEGIEVPCGLYTLLNINSFWGPIPRWSSLYNYQNGQFKPVSYDGSLYDYEGYWIFMVSGESGQPKYYYGPGLDECTCDANSNWFMGGYLF